MSLPKLTRLAPVLPVRDVNAALAHYRALGFTATAYGGEEEGGPVYGFVERDGVQLHVARCAELDPAANTSAVYLYVDDADRLREAWTAAAVQGRFTPPTNTPYGLREFAHHDPDNNLLRVGSPLPRG